MVAILAPDTLTAEEIRAAATWPDVLRDHERDAADACLFEAMTHVGQAHDELCALRASVLLGTDTRSATVRALDLAAARLAFALTATDLVAPRPPCPVCRGTRATHPTGDPADPPESCHHCTPVPATIAGTNGLTAPPTPPAA